MNAVVDVTVIGLGPAGMAAASACAKSGLRVAAIDEQPTPGGQIYRAIERNGDSASYLGEDYTSGGRIVAGATRETGFDYRLTIGGQAEVMNFALALAPGLASATHLETRIGFRPLYAAKTPIIDQAPGVDNLFFGNGLGAGGLTMGPLAGQLLAQRVLGQSPQFDLAPYALPPPPAYRRISGVA